MPCVLNLGSLNSDLVYRVPHIVRPGETLASLGFERHPGGKGANQSVALARAGARVRHLGRVGPDGQWLRTVLAESGVDTSTIAKAEEASGHAIIQVSQQGQNSIVLFPGSNQQIDTAAIDQALAACHSGDVLLTQNETNGIPHAIRAAKARGLQVWCNPAPFDSSVRDWPLSDIDTLIVNETEGRELSQCSNSADTDTILHALQALLPQAIIVLTLGADGVHCAQGEHRHFVSPNDVPVVDTTAAGDTFVGYLLARHLAGDALPAALTTASRAAELSIGRAGAIPAIPTWQEVENTMSHA